MSNENVKLRAQRTYTDSRKALTSEWTRVEGAPVDVVAWGPDWTTASWDDVADEVVVERKDEMLGVICRHYGVETHCELAYALNEVVRDHFFNLRSQPDFKWT